MNKRIVIVLCCILTCLLFSCNFVTKCGIEPPAAYNGDNMDLYTVAAFSILGADSPSTKIRIIEKDQYNRVLFEVRFWEEGIHSFYFQKPLEHAQLYAYAVSQKSDVDHVYYYEDECWTVFEKAEDFTEAEVIALKERNDWDKPIEESRLSSRSIIRRGQAKIDSDWLYENGAAVLNTKNSITSGIILNEGDYLHSSWLDLDVNGKSLFIIWIVHKDVIADNQPNEHRCTAFFVMINKDGSYDITTYKAEINHLRQYWIELKDFKAINHWRGVESQGDGSLDNPYTVKCDNY